MSAVSSSPSAAVLANNAAIEEIMADESLDADEKDALKAALQLSVKEDDAPTGGSAAAAGNLLTNYQSDC